MREPIRAEDGSRSGSETRRAARSIRYCLGWLGASLALILVSACSPGEADKKPDSSDFAKPAVTDAASPVSDASDAERADTPVVLFLGTSLTAGHGLRESQAFPALVQQDIRAANLDYRVVNAGVSGDTSAGGLRRLEWLLRMPVAVMVLELGANDMLRGQSVDQLRSNLEAILRQTREAHPDVRFLIAGMRAAPNLGPDYVREFDAVYPALAAKYHAALVPFLLEDVAGKRELNQADGIHPTAAGDRLIAERVWRALEPLLTKQTS